MVAEAHDLPWFDAQKLLGAAHLERLLQNIHIVVWTLLRRGRPIERVVLLAPLLLGAPNGGQLPMLALILHLDLHGHFRLPNPLHLYQVAILILDLLILVVLVLPFALLGVVVPAREVGFLLFLPPLLPVQFREDLFLDALHLANIILVDLDALISQLLYPCLQLLLRFLCRLLRLDALFFRDLGEASCLPLLRSKFLELLLLRGDDRGLFVLDLFGTLRVVEPVVAEWPAQGGKVDGLQPVVGKCQQVLALDVDVGSGV